ncbi:hypothetical protein [Deinococcus planocerae]|uniref:hypothetical protein n=1 Tax=Deinococcus planocerae TaxID=1737569 RepID=UPI0011AFCEB1|nr:hypothetical protein [Deinococcus planocerae]
MNKVAPRRITALGGYQKVRHGIRITSIKARTIRSDSPSGESLIRNLSPLPTWHDEVTEQVSQRNGKQPRRVVTLEPHLTMKGMQARRDAAVTELERQRWDILCRLAYTLDLMEVTRQVGVSDQTDRALVRRYNEVDPDAVAHGNQGRVTENHRLLTREQEAALQAWLARG